MPNLNCTGVTATITGSLVVNCANGITFTDTTGIYTAGNTTGYGTPNSPNISAITSTVFYLYDSTGVTLLGTYHATYLPSADGTGGTPLTAANFGLSAFTPNLTYVLVYGIVVGATTYTCIQNSFTVPCCGASIPSNLTTRFSIQENIGNGAIVFTDTTGTYNAQTNPGGYGTPNPAYSDITSTLLRITLENGTVIDITNFIPTAIAPSVTLTAATLGYTNNIPDQIIQFTYFIYTTVGQCQVGYANNYILISGNSTACIMGQIQGLLNGDCSCSDDNCSNTDYITKMLFELDAIKIAATGNIGCVAGKIQAYYAKCSGGCTTC